MDVHDVSSHQFPDVGYWRRPMHCELMCGARAATQRHGDEVDLTSSCEDVMNMRRCYDMNEAMFQHRINMCEEVALTRGKYGKQVKSSQIPKGTRQI